jgi:hypothetical protein
MRHTGADLDILRDLANYRSHGSVSQSLVAPPMPLRRDHTHALPTEAVTVGALLCSPHSAFIALRNWNAAGQEMRCVDSKHTIGMRLCSIRSTWGVHGPFSAKRDLVLFVALTQAFGDDPSALHIAGSFVRFHLGHSTPFTIPPVHG